MILDVAEVFSSSSGLFRGDQGRRWLALEESLLDLELRLSTILV